jgi:hypothetical protein
METLVKELEAELGNRVEKLAVMGGRKTVERASVRVLVRVLINLLGILINLEIY